MQQGHANNPTTARLWFKPSFMFFGRGWLQPLVVHSLTLTARRCHQLHSHYLSPPQPLPPQSAPRATAAAVTVAARLVKAAAKSARRRQRSVGEAATEVAGAEAARDAVETRSAAAAGSCHSRTHLGPCLHYLCLTRRRQRRRRRENGGDAIAVLQARAAAPAVIEPAAARGSTPCDAIV